MDHFYRQFTVIDFLSMFIPGAAAVLAVSMTMLPVTAPWYAFFGSDSVIGLSIYFVVISYLVGHMLCQLTKPLERLSFFNKPLTQLRSEYETYVQQKAEKLGLNTYLPQHSGTQTTKMLWRRVYYFTLTHAECSRLRLMHGFYGLFRSLTGTVIVIIFCCFAQIWILRWYLLLAVVCCGVFFVFCFCRAVKFYIVYQQTLFETFLLADESVQGHS